MRTVIAGLLVLVMIGGKAPAQTSLDSSVSEMAQRVSLIPIGSLIEVRFADGKKLRGHLSQAGPDGFSFDKSNVAFSDVKSVTVVKPAHTPIGAWIATGVIVAAVVIGVAVFAIERHNE